ncbi:MAG: DNA mismatch endonuclease Vsr [Terriglobales bacterium]
MDTLSPAQRSRRMSLVRSKDTKPELRVRRIAHRLGYRFRLHQGHLPGKPDLVFTRLRKVVFVHGCFWHRHAGCPRTRTPKSRFDFWVPKLKGNRLRDLRNMNSLRRLGWKVQIIWECETEWPELIEKRLKGFLTK